MATSLKLSYGALVLFLLSLLLPGIYYNLGCPGGAPIGYQEGGYEYGWMTFLVVTLTGIAPLNANTPLPGNVSPRFMTAATIANLLLILTPWLLPRLSKWHTVYRLVASIAVLGSVWGWTLLNDPQIEHCTISDMTGMVEPCYAYGTFVWITSYCVWLLALFQNAREQRTIKN